jgi:hypothetical protein
MRAHSSFAAVLCSQARCGRRHAGLPPPPFGLRRGPRRSASREGGSGSGAVSTKPNAPLAEGADELFSTLPAASRALELDGSSSSDSLPDPEIDRDGESGEGHSDERVARIEDDGVHQEKTHRQDERERHEGISRRQVLVGT